MPIPDPNKSGLIPEERDACAIIGFFNKNGHPSHGNVQRTIDALIKMGHRAGEIGGEGDGCGILTDIPRQLWREILEKEGKGAALADQTGFAVAHILVPRQELAKDEQLLTRILTLCGRHGAQLLVERHGQVRREALSTMAKTSEPLFVQLALKLDDGKNCARTLYELNVAIEKKFPVHVASLSNSVTAYKVHGAPEILSLYYPELKRKEFQSSATIGHSRFSTNTLPTVLRAQPFSLLGHNGEINTIARLREEARMLGLTLPLGGSDSQDLNRTLEGLIQVHGLSLYEAMEVCFPPIFTEAAKLPVNQQQMYTLLRQFFPASAQGPAAVITRWQDQCVFSVDAMGLRPLWFGETNKFYFASSEAGVVAQEEILSDPKVLAPGEKLALQLHPQQGIDVYPHDELRELVYQRMSKRAKLERYTENLLAGDQLPCSTIKETEQFKKMASFKQENLLSGFAWKRSDLLNIKEITKSGHDPIASLGYDGPLAALAISHQNIADYFKEQVAVVTNPAIDRERETEHFSSQVFIGPRPQFSGRIATVTRLAAPLLTGGLRITPQIDQNKTAQQFGLCSIETLLSQYQPGCGKRYKTISCTLKRDENIETALLRLQQDALQAVRRGTQLLFLDDSRAFTPTQSFLDPALVVSSLHKALKAERNKNGQSLRRSTAMVLRSGALRNLHDILFCIAMGADAVCPYMLWELADQAPSSETANGLTNLLNVITRGIEKVMSTMGTHEIGGYGKYFSSIGLSPEIVDVFETPNFCGSSKRGLNFSRQEENNRSRTAIVRSKELQSVPVQFRLYPKIWKKVGAVAKMEESYNDLSKLIREYEIEHPLALRHLLDFKFGTELSVDPQEVDTSIGNHDFPFLISAMSFGSQGETAFRIYAEAAKKLNIICMNGEGGEIPDMLGKYRKNRGQQIASGRFGVHMDLVNSADFLEIKAGQGAKPGEGGHLPGFKVTAKIAAARNSSEGVTLISPSNNHDIYSIEDLAQIIEELRTANPQARISVKVPAVAGIGTISMGIAKAGADIITISGYDGGTGAARKHAIKFVGLPAEIGVREAHRALSCCGLRDKVEIWADGGARTGRDVVKMMLLGANRVGFGTLPMVVIGCTACRNCHLGTCHVGIATQIESEQEAHSKGLKRFIPRVLENGIIYETTFFRAIGEEIRNITAKLGFTRSQDLVGQSCLLEQTHGQDVLELDELLRIESCEIGQRGKDSTRLIRKPLNYLTSLLSTLVTDAFDEGEQRVRFVDDGVNSCDRSIGTRLAGAMTQAYRDGRYPLGKQAHLHFRRDSIPGNGLGAFNIEGINISVEGGAQDGVGKGALGGRIVILKGENIDGKRVGGSVGKGLAYGAQGGLFIIQGDADSRACIRLSGADVVLGARIHEPRKDTLANIAGHANLKGFAFEYMTSGRVVVLGDPGPWICSGMTGGTVYCYLDPEMNMDRSAIRQRLAWGAKVELNDVDDNDIEQIDELLMEYHKELLHSNQHDEAQLVGQIMAHSSDQFIKITALAEES
ncbi:MAG: glutamate synthase [Desulfobacteraceae bacterium 4572_35.2]|nr:MAG: glutamate synthase [Desulfobacteraceae bacterium 4572_35.2]